MSSPASVPHSRRAAPESFPVGGAQARESGGGDSSHEALLQVGTGHVFRKVAGDEGVAGADGVQDFDRDGCLSVLDAANSGEAPVHPEFDDDLLGPRSAMDEARSLTVAAPGVIMRASSALAKTIDERSARAA